jgi:hypothetical protein
MHHLATVGATKAAQVAQHAVKLGHVLDLTISTADARVVLLVAGHVRVG